MYAKFKARVYSDDEGCGECDFRGSDLRIVVGIKCNGEGRIVSIDTVTSKGVLEEDVKLGDFELLAWSGVYGENQVEIYEPVL